MAVSVSWQSKARAKVQMDSSERAAAIRRRRRVSAPARTTPRSTMPMKAQNTMKPERLSKNQHAAPATARNATNHQTLTTRVIGRGSNLRRDGRVFITRDARKLLKSKHHEDLPTARPESSRAAKTNPCPTSQAHSIPCRAQRAPARTQPGVVPRECILGAPSKVPCPSGDRVKTNRRDADCFCCGRTFVTPGPSRGRRSTQGEFVIRKTNHGCVLCVALPRSSEVLRRDGPGGLRRSLGTGGRSSMSGSASRRG